MSDFDSMAYDAAYDQYIAGIVCDKVMENATLQQCIYLFVEGRTEEVAYPELLAKCDLDTDELGIVVANYGGASSLIHCLRLLKKTLSHDRPVVATIDNDEKGRDTLTRLEHLDFDMDLVSIFPLPKIDPPLRYPDGNRGGSFEELFSCQLFVNQAFSPDFIPAFLLDQFSSLSSSIYFLKLESCGNSLIILLKILSGNR